MFKFINEIHLTILIFNHASNKIMFFFNLVDDMLMYSKVILQQATQPFFLSLYFTAKPWFVVHYKIVVSILDRTNKSSHVMLNYFNVSCIAIQCSHLKVKFLIIATFLMLALSWPTLYCTLHRESPITCIS